MGPAYLDMPNVVPDEGIERDKAKIGIALEASLSNYMTKVTSEEGLRD